MNLGNVLVTGGAGFLGSELVKKLIPVSNHIYVMDDLSVGSRERVPKSERVTFFVGSIANESLLDEILPQVEIVFHLACKNILLSVQNVMEDFHTNLYGGFTLLRKAQERCPNLKRFIYTSTASVYGQASVLPTPESYHNVNLPYSASKFSTEHYCKVFHQMYGMPVTILRLSNVYGPGQMPSNPYSGVISKFFAAIGKKEPLILYGDGKQTRDFTFVDDALDAVVQSALSPKVVGNVYNVGTGEETSILELADKIIQICGYEKYPKEFHPKRAVDIVNRRALDISCIQSDLGWSPRHSLEEGLLKTYHWFKSVHEFRTTVET